MTGLRTQAAVRNSSSRELELASGGKRCASTCCSTKVRVGNIFCLQHWHMLPRWLQESIKSTFFDAEWTAHQDAIRQASDLIDRMRADAFSLGFTHLIAVKIGERWETRMGRRL